MEKEQAKKILDDITKAVKIMQQHEDYICCSTLDEVHMSKCIRDIASAMEFDVTEEDWGCEDMVATEISFMYEGIRFFELESYRKREEDAGAD